MGLLECASNKSIFRGYDYYKGKHVLSLVQISKDQYNAAVTGTSPSPYEVLIDLSHPRKSKCSCPHANGRRIVCKHMLAVYFTAFPDEAQRIYEKQIAGKEEEPYDEWDEYEYEDDEYEDEDDEYKNVNRVIEHIRKMKKSELQQALVQVLFDGPKWQYNRFVEEHCMDDDW